MEGESFVEVNVSEDLWHAKRYYVVNKIYSTFPPRSKDGIFEVYFLQKVRFTLQGVNFFGKSFLIISHVE